MADNIQILHDMAQALLEKETIVLEDIQNIIDASKSGVTAESKSQSSDDEMQPVEEPLEEQAEEKPAETESAEAESYQKTET